MTGPIVQMDQQEQANEQSSKTERGKRSESKERERAKTVREGRRCEGLLLSDIATLHRHHHLPPHFHHQPLRATKNPSRQLIFI